jgi:hypothetical protein
MRSLGSEHLRLDAPKQRLQDRCCPNFSSSSMASRFGPTQPRGMTWNGTGGSEIFSQSRQVIFSRKCWATFR